MPCRRRLGGLRNPLGSSADRSGSVGLAKEDRGVMKRPEPGTRTLLAHMAFLLMVLFIGLGVAWYGVSVEVLGRIWQNVLDRPGGPMTFRFVLQPVMAAVAAVYDGMGDARAGRSPYLWTIFTRADKRTGRLCEGLIATARIILLGLCMDTIYQFIAFDTFHPAEAVVVTILLAFLPYLLLRGPAARLAYRLHEPEPSNDNR